MIVHVPDHLSEHPTSKINKIWRTTGAICHDTNNVSIYQNRHKAVNGYSASMPAETLPAVILPSHDGDQVAEPPQEADAPVIAELQRVSGRSLA